MPSRGLLDPHRGHPRREFRAFVEIGGDRRGGAEEGASGPTSVMGDQRQRDRGVLHVLGKAPSDVVERIAVRLPPFPPDAVGDRIEEFRLLPEVGDGEGEGHLFVG
jgi:hypothetical protein